MSSDHTKPSNLEDEYFAREEIEQKRRLAQKQSEATAVAQREALKQQHFMKCPKCGFDLHTLEKGKVEIDTCFNCKGVWLDHGELEAMLKVDEQSGSWTRAVLNLFKHK